MSNIDDNRGLFHSRDNDEGIEEQGIIEEQAAIPRRQLTSMSVADLMSKGLLIMKYDSRRQARVQLSTNIDRFVSGYGTSPTVVHSVMTDVKDKYNISPSSRLINDTLLAFDWLNSDASENVLAGRHEVCDKTVRSRSKGMTAQIAGLYEDKIYFDCHEDELIPWTVDGVNFTHNEYAKDPSAKYYDPKSHSAGVKYEIAIAIRTARIVWTNGPFPAATHDITVFRGGKPDQPQSQWNQDSLYFQMPSRTKCLGDSGYGGEPDKVLVKKREHSEELKNFIERALSRHETVNGKLKKFRILEDRFSHGQGTNQRMNLHKSVFRAIVVIVQTSFDCGINKPFDV